jgi:hypothetical protein
VGRDQHLRSSVAVVVGEPGVITRLAGLILSQSRTRGWLGSTLQALNRTGPTPAVVSGCYGGQARCHNEARRSYPISVADSALARINSPGVEWDGINTLTWRWLGQDQAVSGTGPTPAVVSGCYGGRARCHNEARRSNPISVANSALGRTGSTLQALRSVLIWIIFHTWMSVNSSIAQEVLEDFCKTMCGMPSTPISVTNSVLVRNWINSPSVEWDGINTCGRQWLLWWASQVS